jgi:hypothetical protein
MINNEFPSVYSTFEQQAMMAFSMNSDQLLPYGGMVGMPTSHDEAIQRAAQAALEVFQTYDDLDFSCTIVKPDIPMEELDLEPEEEEEDVVIQTVKGRYMCPRPNCSKLYKNRNGLKYHLQKGSCRLPIGGYVDGNSPQGIIIHSNDPDEIKKMKPFWCKKCSKRYKNLNGLKYHGRVEHPELEFERIRGQSKD